MNLYQIVTEELISKIEASGELPWTRPWNSLGAPKNLTNGKEYRGVNVWMLGASMFPRPEWASALQYSKMGATIRAGERSSIVVYFKVSDGRELNPKTGKLEKRFLLRYSRVWNISQVIHGDIPLADKLGLTANAGPAVPNIAKADAIMERMPNRPVIKTASRAAYSPSEDVVYIPERNSFVDSAAYYDVLFHETVHCTAHESRVGREVVNSPIVFGSADYSREELVAQLGASLLCGVVGIFPQTKDRSAAYLKNWCDRLRGDSRLIVTAASAASKAVDYIRGPQAEEVAEVEAEQEAELVAA
jgi:antirestriction protein ArdC